MSKYEKWYAAITENAKNRNLTSYTETHHILPKSLGGNDLPFNLVKLTAREHFICHWLLTKITTGEDRYKMLNALRMMRAEKPGQERYKSRITARVYEAIKEEYAQLHSIKVSGANNPMYGDKFYRSEEGKLRQKEAISGDKNGSKQAQARQKIAQSKLGKSRPEFSDEWKAKLSAAKQGENNNMYGKKHTAEARAKQSAKAIGRKQSEETKQKKADAIRGLVREKKRCPHCNQEVAVNGYARWHGDRCRQNPSNKGTV